jgi:hypothetical protein
MTAGHIAAVFVALLCVELSAQPAPQGNVTIQVTDITGAVIPGASIEIDHSTSNSRPIQETDRQGKAVLVLPIGIHTLSTTFPAFRRQTQQIDVRGGNNPPVVVALEVASGDFVTVEATSDMPPSDSPVTVFLPLEPVLNFNPLPLKSGKRHW